ncbi:unnamed protein product [Orchesella dallaii]|uniref:Uncharacterized protein n=1 Tax=Orchesella dallaii TaxID=48710 RepID=A0ABP1RG09_9HEXA
MGSSQVEDDVVLAEVDIAEESSHHNSDPHHQHKEHRKHRKKKVSVNNDADIVTPYQNGHYVNPSVAVGNGHHNYPPHRSHRHYEDGDIRHQNGFSNSEVDLAGKDYLSPPPPIADERGGAQSSLSSINNAITVAPSRTNLNDSNVFVGGRPPNNHLKRPNQFHRNNRHHKHKGRSRTPDFISSNHRLRLDDEPHDSQSILNRIDLSIRKNFGDWDCDEETVSKKVINPEVPKPQNGHVNRPYFIPKTVVCDTDGIVNEDGGNLPRLFKNYDNVVTTSRQVLTDRSYKIALSKDNSDPNSILSQAKKTLSYVSGQS